MNRTFMISAALLLFVLQTYAQQMGDSFARAKSTKKANLVYVHPNVKGFAATDSYGKASGLLVDLMVAFEKYVQDTYGIAVSSEYAMAPDKDFGKYLQEVKQSTGGVFGLANTSIKEERKKVYDFSPPFLNNISVLISHKGMNTLASMDQAAEVFAGKQGYAVEGTTNHARMMKLKAEQFPAMQVTLVNSSREIVENISKDPNGYGFVDIHYYLEFLNEGKEVKRHPVGDETGDKFGVLMPKGSDWAPVLTDFFNTGLLKTPQYRQMVSDNLGKGALRMLN